MDDNYFPCSPEGPEARRRIIRERLRRRRRNRRIALLLSLLLALGAGAVGTLAYILTRTGETENIFTPGKAACEVTEDFDGTVKSNVAVKNTGNTDVYIRAAVNVTWVQEDESGGRTAAAAVPRAGVDYTLTLAENTGWILGSDGFWYYQTPVAPGESTGVLIERCALTGDAAIPAGCRLSVEILSSSLQAVPASAVQEHWGVELEGSRIIGSEVKE